MKKFACGKLALLVFLGGVNSSLYGNTAPCQNADWPMFMHDLQHTGCSSSSAPDSLYLLWEYDTGQRLFGSPVVSNGTVYQVGRGYLFALRADTGNLLWSCALPVVGSTPFVDGERLYVGTCNGLAALNAKTGEVLWQVQLADFGCDSEDDLTTFLASSPMVIDTGVIMCTHRNYEMIYVDPPRPDPEGINRVVCVDSETGTLMWEYPLEFRGGYSPVFVDGQIIINSTNLEALDERGQALWSYPDLYLYDTSPAVGHNALVSVSDDKGVVSSIDLATHTLLWQCNLGRDIFSTPAVAGVRIIVAAHKGTVTALHGSTGDILWKREFQEKPDISSRDVVRNWAALFLCSPAIADDKVYVGLWSGTFLCLDLETGETLWQYRTGGSIVASPAVADEKVFVASTDGTLYCFGIDPETYFEKAEEYEKQRNREKAKEFYGRAKEYYQEKKNMEMVEKCDRKLEEKTYLPLLAVSLGVLVAIVLLIYSIRKKKTE